MHIEISDSKEKKKEYLDHDILEKVGEWGKKDQDLRSFIFNSRIIYPIRNIIKTANLDVSWGIPINDRRDMGPESDIIIFRGKPANEWNGFGVPPVIRIAFVNIRNIVRIIECKKRISIDRKNTSLINKQEKLRDRRRKYTSFGIPQNILWLLSERIDYHGNEEKSRIKNNIINRVGFARFFYLTDEKEGTINYSDWILFLNEVAQLR